MLIALQCKLNVAAAAAAEEATIYVPFKARIVSATLSPDVAAAASATHFATLALTANNGAGGAFTAIATSQTTEAVAHAVGTVLPYTVTVPHLAAGSVVKLAKAATGDGVAVEPVLSLLLEKVL